MALAGLLAVFLLLLDPVKRIVPPGGGSYEKKQRRFITTDAGHELKTPLTIIGADLNLVEQGWRGNEWLQDIRCQVRRLTRLTQDLIFLSRMEEGTPPIQPIEFQLSDLTEDGPSPFRGLAKAQGKGLVLSIQPMLSYTGTRMPSGGFCPFCWTQRPGNIPQTRGEVEDRTEEGGASVRLSVSNTIDPPHGAEMLDRLFDRFYRGDQSAASRPAATAWDLSITKGIVLAHRGKIRAEAWRRPMSMIVSLPV